LIKALSRCSLPEISIVKTWTPWSVERAGALAEPDRSNVEVEGDLKTLKTNLDKVRRLRCEQFNAAATDGDSNIALSNLDALDIIDADLPARWSHRKLDGNRPSRTSHVDEPRIRILRLPLAELSGVDFTGLQTLEHLYLFTPTSPFDDHFAPLDKLSLLRSLNTLSLDLHMNRQHTSYGLKRFLANVPPDFSRLEFPSRIPFDVLLPGIESIISLDTLVVSHALPHELKKRFDLDSLKTLCDRSGIKFYYASKEQVDVFSESHRC
jgi:hypothetical protein